MKDEEKQCCSNCLYFRVTEEYWHDHYLIPEHTCCVYFDRYRPKDVDPKGVCEHYEKMDRRKSNGVIW